MGAQNFTFEGCWHSYRQNMRGVVTTLSVAVQNAVPYRDVGVATAGLQFCRSLGGMMGPAITGVVMVQRFRSGVEAAVPDDAGAALPAQLLASVKDDPRALVDPATARALQESLAETGMGDVAVADRRLGSLNLALTDALSDVFTVLWVAVALSFAVALCLRVHNEQGTLWSPLKSSCVPTLSLRGAQRRGNLAELSDDCSSNEIATLRSQ